MVCLVWFWSRLVWKVTQDYSDSEHDGLMVTPIHILENCVTPVEALTDGEWKVEQEQQK